MAENPQLSIIIPALNEEASISSTLKEAIAALSSLKNRFEIIVVDDGSSDETFAKACEVAQENQMVRVLRFRRNLGKATALQKGIEVSRGRILITMDADGQDDPSMIGALLEKLEKDTDLVVGWKKTRKDPWTRRFVSRIFNSTVNFFFHTKLHDQNCGLKAGRREVFESISLYGELHRFIPALVSSQGFRVTELVVHHRERMHGKSRYGWSRHFRGALDLLTALMLTRYARRPLHLLGGIGSLLCITGGLALSYLVLIWFMGQGPIGTRPLLSFGIFIFIVGLQFIFMGLLGELIAHQAQTRKTTNPVSDIFPIKENV